MEAKLCLHTGGQRVSLSDILAVPTPPVVGRYTPIGHAALLERVQRFLNVDGFKVVQTELALAKEGARFFGLMQLQHPSLMSTEHAYVMGIRNSHDKTFPASVVVGISPFVCDNLAFSPGADGLSVTRRHVGSIYSDLNLLVGSLVEKLALRFQLSDNRVLAYKSADLTQKDSDHFIMELHRQGVIKPTDIYRLAAEYAGTLDATTGKPAFRHEEFAPRTAYSLFNALTQLLKGIDKEGNANPDLWTLPRTTATAYSVFDALLGIKQADAEVIA